MLPIIAFALPAQRRDAQRIEMLEHTFSIDHITITGDI